MLFKLAVRNIKSHPFRTAATIVAIAVSIAMIFSMLSFKSSVYDYIFQTETADAGEGDIVILSNSVSARIIDPLDGEAFGGEGRVSWISPALSLYALFDNEYVRLRGFESGKLELLNGIDAIEGSVETLNGYSDRVAVSKKCAEHFGLKIGDEIQLSLGNNSTSLYVGVIAENNGYFLKDSPYLIIGTSGEGISRLIGEGAAVYNEIYIKAAQAQDIGALINDISAIEEYSDMSVTVSKDAAYIEEQTNSITAPVVLAGGAVLLLGIACIAVLFLLSEKEKRAYLSKLSVVGATRGQIFTVFLIESLILSFSGAVIGTLLASGVFVALLKITLSSVISFKVSAVKLLISAAIGIFAALLSSLLPLIKAFSSSARENMLTFSKSNKAEPLIMSAVILTALIALIVENTLPGAKGILSIVDIILILAALTCAASAGIKLVALSVVKLSAGGLRQSGGGIRNAAINKTDLFLKKERDAKSEAACVNAESTDKYSVQKNKKSSSQTAVLVKTKINRFAAFSMLREKRFRRQNVLLALGMSVSMMLFMAWSLTTSIFNSYQNDFKNMIFVSNVPASVDVSQFEKADGVDGATAMVWRKIDLYIGGQVKTVNLLGSEDIIDIVDFDFATSEAEIKDQLSSNGNYVVLDVAMRELYGVDKGDTVYLEADGVKAEFKVAGIVSHRLFSGNYAVVSKSALGNAFSIKPDTVLVVADDAAKVANELRAEFSQKNYYVVEALEAYRWDRESMDAVFSLIGTLAVVVALFIFLVTTAAVAIGRSGVEKERNALLVAGLSKNGLMYYELFQHIVTALTAFICSVAASVALSASLINALRLFGLYFEFMYSAGVVFAVGAVFAASYILLPLVLRYKKGYNIKKL